MFLVIAKRRIVFTKSHAKLKVDLQIKGGGKYFNFALFFSLFCKPSPRSQKQNLRGMTSCRYFEA